MAAGDVSYSNLNSSNDFGPRVCSKKILPFASKLRPGARKHMERGPDEFGEFSGELLMTSDCNTTAPNSFPPWRAMDIDILMVLTAETMDLHDLGLFFSAVRLKSRVSGLR